MPEEYPKTVILPASGKTAVIQRRLKGRDLRMVERIAGRNADTMQRGFAMISQVILVDDHPVVMEDFDDWDLEDINELFNSLGLAANRETQGEDGEKKSQTVHLSPNLSNGGFQRQN